MNSNDLKGFKGVFILVQCLNPKKRVRLIDGRLTPVFDYSGDAFNYCKLNNINNCRIIKIKKKENKDN